ncbi:MAG: AMP-binding protein [Candidatus Nanopelagicales bacterium]
MDVIRHQDPGAQQRIHEYLAAASGGLSALVRPIEPLDGLEAITAHFRALSDRSVIVTDLATESAHLAPSEDGDASARGTIVGFHTSGSTGRPKCVIYDRATVEAHARTIASTLRLDDRWTFVALPPVRYAYGLSILHSHAGAGVPLTYLQSDWGLPGLAAIEESGSTPLAIYMLPQHTPLVLSAELPPDRVGRLIVAGGRLSAASAESLAAAFPDATLDNMYGQAEMGPRLSMWTGPLVRFREGNIGHPIPGVELRVADDTPTGQPGHILARSRYAMKYYLQHPYDRIAPGPGQDTFVDTGDLGEYQEDGDLLHYGRSDRWLNIAGTRVDLQAIERIVDDCYHPLLVKATGEPARVTGDNVAVVEIVQGSRPITDLGEVRRTLHEELGGLASMVRIRVVDHLSTGESGK